MINLNKKVRWETDTYLSMLGGSLYYRIEEQAPTAWLKVMGQVCATQVWSEFQLPTRTQIKTLTKSH